MRGKSAGEVDETALVGDGEQSAAYGPQAAGDVEARGRDGFYDHDCNFSGGRSGDRGRFYPKCSEYDAYNRGKVQADDLADARSEGKVQ